MTIEIKLFGADYYLQGKKFICLQVRNVFTIFATIINSVIGFK